MARVLGCLLLLATAARADTGGWAWFELRLPLREPREGQQVGVKLRVNTDLRFSVDGGGLAQAFLRVGPLIDLTPWLFLGLHGVVYADRRPNGTFDQEGRVEIEPNLYGRLGRFTFNDRNRFEFRVRSSGERFRYRNQLRVNYAPVGARWIPFLWDEVLVDLSGTWVSENRAAAGLARMLGDTTRIEAGYMLRSRLLDERWQHDHVIILWLFVAPRSL